jgi:hypothetical protein
MDKLPVPQLETLVLFALAMSMWQASRLIVYSAAWEEPVINLPLPLPLPLFSFPVRERKRER